MKSNIYFLLLLLSSAAIKATEEPSQYPEIRLNGLDEYLLRHPVIPHCYYTPEYSKEQGIQFQTFTYIFRFPNDSCNQTLTELMKAHDIDLQTIPNEQWTRLDHYTEILKTNDRQNFESTKVTLKMKIPIFVIDAFFDKILN